MINRILLAFLILHSSFLISQAQPITPPISSTPFTRTFLRATNAEAAVATLGMTAVTLTNYAGVAAAATNAQFAAYATNIPWSAVTTAAGAEAEPNLTLSTLTVGDVVGGTWGAVNGILYGNGSGLTNISTATNTQGGVLKLGPTFETTLTSDANGLVVNNLASSTIQLGTGGPRIQATGGSATAAPLISVTNWTGTTQPAISISGTNNPAWSALAIINGRVGIRTNSPLSTFDVLGSGYFATDLRVENNLFVANSISAPVLTTSGSYIRSVTPTGAGSDKALSIGPYQDGLTNLFFGYSLPNAAARSTNVNFQFLQGFPPTFLLRNGTNGSADMIVGGSLAASNYCFIVTNGTISNSVIGMVVEFNPASNFCYQACAASSQTPIGVVLDAGVAPGGPVRIADRGFVRVLVDSATTTNWPGAWIGTSATTPGRCVILTDPPSAGVHDRELGHGAVSAAFAASDATTNLTTVLLHLGR